MGPILQGYQPTLQDWIEMLTIGPPVWVLAGWLGLKVWRVVRNEQRDADRP